MAHSSSEACMLGCNAHLISNELRTLAREPGARPNGEKKTSTNFFPSMSSPQEKSNVASAGTGLLQVVGHTASMNNAPTAMPTNETYGSSTGGEMTASASASAATLTITEEEARPPREDFDELLTLSLRARPSVRWYATFVFVSGELVLCTVQSLPRTLLRVYLRMLMIHIIASFD
jgi:hypothetical protein